MFLFCLNSKYVSFNLYDLFFVVSRSSSTLLDYKSDNSIDGVLSTFITVNEPFPWLEIELDTERLISGIVVLNRMDCCGTRLRELEVRVGNNPVPLGYPGEKLKTNVVAGHFAGPGVDGETYPIDFTPSVRGRYISLQLLVEDNLQIEEVYLAGG